ncbi:MAG: SCO family protein [Gemmatimonadota bacterium]
MARGTGLHGAVLPEARPKGDFTLTATDGEPWNFREETDGRITLLFFGYTHCPNACPVQMATLGAAYGKLPWKLQDRIEVVFVTTDPARDTLSRLDSWLDNFHESFVGLRGSRGEVNRIMESYGLPPARIDTAGTAGEGYTVGHAAHVLLFTPDDSLRMMYPTGTRQKAWVEDLRTLAREGTDAVLPAGGSSPGDAAAGGG